MTDASRLADSLRSMAQQTKNHRDAWRPHHYKEPLTFVMAGNLIDAADLIERQAAELAEWRSVFGHLGATPDDCGNALVEARRVPRELLTDSEAAALAANGKAVS